MEKKDLNDEKLLYNVRETAAVLGVNVNMVYELIKRKLLPALKGGCNMVTPEFAQGLQAASRYSGFFKTR